MADQPGDVDVLGGGFYTAIGARRVAGVGEYRTRCTSGPTGPWRMVGRTVSGSPEATFASLAVPGLTYAAGDRIFVRTQVTGASPTTISARAWKAGTVEPTTWQLSRTDTTAGLQAPGFVGLNHYLSSTATNGPVEAALDDLVARAP